MVGFCHGGNLPESQYNINDDDDDNVHINDDDDSVYINDDDDNVHINDDDDNVYINYDHQKAAPAGNGPTPRSLRNSVSSNIAISLYNHIFSANS